MTTYHPVDLGLLVDVTNLEHQELLEELRCPRVVTSQGGHLGVPSTVAVDAGPVRPAHRAPGLALHAACWASSTGGAVLVFALLAALHLLGVERGGFGRVLLALGVCLLLLATVTGSTLIARAVAHERRAQAEPSRGAPSSAVVTTPEVRSLLA